MASSASTAPTTTSTTRARTHGSTRRAAAAGRQPRGRGGAGRHALRHRRLHRAEPQAARRMLRLVCARATTWRRIAPLPAACGSVACVVIDGKLHGIGGAVGDTFDTKKSVDWHLVYDPRRRPLGARRAAAHRPRPRRRGGGQRPDPRDRRARGQLQHQQQPAPRLRPARPTSGRRATRCPRRARATAPAWWTAASSSWAAKAPTACTARTRPTTSRSDSWKQYAPMPTPRHGLGAAAIGNTIYVAGGGAVVGGNIQSAVHEAFVVSRTAESPSGSACGRRPTGRQGHAFY